jgi:hypothetical protein
MASRAATGPNGAEWIHTCAFSQRLAAASSDAASRASYSTPVYRSTAAMVGAERSAALWAMSPN